MQRREDWRGWLEQAQEDLRSAQHLVETDFRYLACFQAQQAAEKALKALLYYQGEELVIGPSVEQLCQKASTYLPEIKERCEDWGYLDNFYVPTRYPNALPPGTIPARVYDERAAQLAVGLASEVLDFVRQRVGGP